MKYLFRGNNKRNFRGSDRCCISNEEPTTFPKLVYPVSSSVEKLRNSEITLKKYKKNGSW
jgi:hypothetical protein